MIMPTTSPQASSPWPPSPPLSPLGAALVAASRAIAGHAADSLAAVSLAVTTAGYAHG